MTMGPLVIAFLISFYYIVQRCRLGDCEKLKLTKKRCYTSFLAFTYLVFPGSSLVVLRAFACDKNFDIDDEYGTNASYLKYDFSIDCNADDYLWGWRLYSVLMVGIYPVGIPLLYFALVHLSRASLNPDPLFVASDTVSEESVAGVEVTPEMKELAATVIAIYHEIATLKKTAAEIHNKALEGQRIQHDLWERESGLVDFELKQRPTGPTRHGSSFSDEKEKAYFGIQKSVQILKEAIVVPNKWEDYLPGYALVCKNLESSVGMIEQELVALYRTVDPSAQTLGFLTAAYEPRFYYWECVECFRRLALTGLLVFVNDGSVLQIVVASVICLAALQLYVRYNPYLDDELDRVMSIAQLMTFAQLFAALLIKAGVIQDYLPNGAISGGLFAANGAVAAGSIKQSPTEDQQKSRAMTGMWAYATQFRLKAMSEQGQRSMTLRRNCVTTVEVQANVQATNALEARKKALDSRTVAEEDRDLLIEWLAKAKRTNITKRAHANVRASHELEGDDLDSPRVTQITTDAVTFSTTHPEDGGAHETDFDLHVRYEATMDEPEASIEFAVHETHAVGGLVEI